MTDWEQWTKEHPWWTLWLASAIWFDIACVFGIFIAGMTYVVRWSCTVGCA